MIALLLDSNPSAESILEDEKGERFGSPLMDKSRNKSLGKIYR